MERLHQLANIELSTLDHTKPLTGIPEALAPAFWRAVERLISNYRFDQGMSDGYMVETSLAQALEKLPEILRWSRSDEESSKPLEEGRIFSATLGAPMICGLPVSFSIPFLAGLILVQIDRLATLYQRNDFNAALHVMQDLLDLESELSRVEEFECLMADAEWTTSSEARKRAKKRHSGTNEQIPIATNEWDETGHTYSGMAAFARHRHKAFGVTERTLYGWIREHRKTTT